MASQDHTQAVRSASRTNARTIGPILGLLFVVAGLAGCGGSSGSSNTTASESGSAAQVSQGGSSNGSTAPGGSEASRSSKPAHLPSGTIASVNGTPISTAAYKHQLQIGASAAVKPLIANASDYSACTAAVKAREERTRKLVAAQEEKYAKRFPKRNSSAPFVQRRKTTDAQRKQQCEFQYKAAKQQALSSLIRRVWTDAQAKELGVSVSESEVTKQLKVREASQKALAKSARSREFLAEAPRYTGTDLKEMVTSQLLEGRINTKIREKFTTSGSVSQSRLEKYFNEHKQAYARPESRSIVFATSKSQSVAEAVAKEHSGGLQSAASKHGIKATPTALGCQRPSGAKSAGTSIVAEAICSAKTGVISAAVKVASTYYVFEVKSVTPGTQPSFSQEKEQIKRLLASQGQGQGVVKYNEETRIKQREKTECATGYLTPLCKEYTVPKPKTITKVKPLTPKK
jgi:PPIC-type PPIASE domain